jgi:hypothetical protein
MVPRSVMAISLESIREVASTIARQQNEQLQVVGVLAGGEHVEILLSLSDCEIEPCRVMLSVARDVSAEELHSAIAEALERHLAGRKPVE